MNIKTALGLAVILTLAFVLAAQYKTAPNRPSDFRDAIVSEEAVKQLQDAVPAQRDSDRSGSPATIPAPTEPAAAQSAADDRSVTHIFSENDPWHKRLAQALGLNYPCAVETSHLGSARQQTEKLTLDDGRRKESVVVKHYNKPSLMSQLPSHAAALYKKMLALFSLYHEDNYRKDSPVKMFNNGVAMNEKFKVAGLKTLEIVLTDPENRIVVTKFLKEGVNMLTILPAAFRGDADAVQAVEKLGAALAAVHRNNFSIGDLNSGNVMFADGEPYFIDLDRARVGGSRAWDIALVFYYPILVAQVSGEPQEWALVARTFLHGYLAGGGDVSIVKEARGRRYIASLAPLYAVRGRSAIRAVRREMKKVAGEGPAEESDEALGLVP